MVTTSETNTETRKEIVKFIRKQGLINLQKQANRILDMSNVTHPISTLQVTLRELEAVEKNVFPTVVEISDSNLYDYEEYMGY